MSAMPSTHSVLYHLLRGFWFQQYYDTCTTGTVRVITTQV